MLYKNSFLFFYLSMIKLNFFKKNNVFNKIKSGFFINCLPFFYKSSYYIFLNNFYLFKKIFKVNNTYFFFLHVNFILKLYKNMFSVIYNNFLLNNKVIFFNCDDLFMEIQHFNLFMFNYTFLNIFQKIIAISKKICTNFRGIFLKNLSLFFSKYRIHMLLLLTSKNMKFYKNIAISCNLPIIGLSTVLDNQNFFDFPLFIPNNNIVYRYILLNEVASLYLLSKSNMQQIFAKKFIFFLLNFYCTRRGRP